MRFPMDRFKVRILKVSLVVWGAGIISNRNLDNTISTHFLKGVVTGRERLKFGFITRGLSRICGPSDDRLGSEVIGGGAEDETTGG